MGEIVVIEKENYPVLMGKNAAMEALAENFEGESLSANDLDRIKVPSGGGTSWEIETLMGVKNVDKLEAIIAFTSPSRQYWPGEYDGGNEPPQCHSDNMTTGIGDPGGNCATCPNNQYESAARGSGKACKETHNVCLFLPGESIPRILTVPPSSLKNFKKYRLRLASSGGVKLWQIKSVITLKKAKSSGGITYSQVEFGADGFSFDPSDEEGMKAFAKTVSDLKAMFEADGRTATERGQSAGEHADETEESPFPGSE